MIASVANASPNSSGPSGRIQPPLLTANTGARLITHIVKNAARSPNRCAVERYNSHAVPANRRMNGARNRTLRRRHGGSIRRLVRNVYG